MKQPIKTALIGLGLSGQVFHLPFLRENKNFEVTTVLSRNEELKNKLLPNAKRVTEFEEVLNSNIDLIVIASPNSTHFSYGKQAIEKGIDFVVEKPFANTYQEAKQLQELAQRNGTKIHVFQNRRLDGDFLTLKKIIQEKTLGKLSLFESHFDRFSPVLKGNWREEKGAGNGVFFDLASHLIDQIVGLFGTPEEVLCDLSIQRPQGVVNDYFHVVMRYGQMRAIAHGSCFVMGPKPRFFIHGDQGSFVKYGLDPQEKSLRAGEHPSEEGFGTEPQHLWGKLYNEKETQTIRTVPGDYAQFYQTVADKHALVEPQEAVEVIRILEACEKSYRDKSSITL